MDKNEIRELMRFFDKSEITKLKIKEGDFTIELQKGFEGGVTYAAAPTVSAPVVVAAQASSAPVAIDVAVLATKAELSIKSPMVGTFYKSPSPGSDSFVKIGSVVKKGQTIAIIEAMKIMNEIEAEFDCRIVEILAEDGQPVEYDMPIYAVEKV
ncbi:MAG: acetyl-CoA carboxylase biotin carboxyl carrier protein [Campylobacteraceae bacterium]|nr:acetyl-CoA carboxylase biotin carboxyl carrier protein [Campylobacteraceae bacterium]